MGFIKQIKAIKKYSQLRADKMAEKPLNPMLPEKDKMI